MYIDFFAVGGSFDFVNVLKYYFLLQITHFGNLYNTNSDNDFKSIEANFHSTRYQEIWQNNIHIMKQVNQSYTKKKKNFENCLYFYSYLNILHLLSSRILGIRLRMAKNSDSQKPRNPILIFVLYKLKEIYNVRDICNIYPFEIKSSINN